MAHSGGSAPVHLRTKRPLVCLSRGLDMALVRYLTGRHWDVICARSVSAARRFVKPGIVHVGIVDLDCFQVDELAQLEPILNSGKVGWIAIASPQYLADPAVRRFIRQHCFDYVKGKPVHPEIDYLAERAYQMVTLGDVDRTPDIGTKGLSEMIGSSDVMKRLFRTVRKAANTEATVFIAGESGTGKELTALAIHENSPRRNSPFIAVNCGAIPHHLLQSELFGYERGAFTGANQRRIGRIEAARGGTLFLDEIGDMPLESQTSMLRFLQEGKIERLGSHESISVDVRIIAATHVDVEAAVHDGRFRADLFHRICVLRINEPPLRERGKDIELLARHMLQKFRPDAAHQIRGFARSAIEAMHNYSWPGNVRELINRIRRAIVMTDSRLISAADLDLEQYIAVQAPTLAEAREHAEKHVIEAALLRHRRRHAQVADDLGVSRATLCRLLNKYDL
ncbi:Fis family transcriptional regulator [Burkholderia sp. Nafp2/4-1b]|uniref:sigma-54 dependent transcriptional regulator n=1 Tax=Burkholderia sp. Nafp2/4-1b TaxID=2116686 RepID=UPI000EF8FD9D|nr:sigma-54 dependent transcriptional regulator [Burkholderia sp. Nafp2/4-1b]RKT99483.1 Fis family transcriptional regulator [Burkholderia sp. Nafp2/4-1b]